MSARIAVVMATVLVALFGVVTPCAACSCAEMTSTEVLESAHMVFSGEVVEVRDTHALFQIDTVWKGTSESSTVKVTRGMGPGDCGIQFSKGLSYTVVAYPSEDDVLESSICAGAQSVTMAEIFSRFGPGTQIEAPPFQPLPSDEQSLPRQAVTTSWLLVAGGIMAGFGAVGIVVWRRIA